MRRAELQGLRVGWRLRASNRDSTPATAADDSLRILAHVASYVPTTRGGAELALHSVLQELQTRGYLVRVALAGAEVPDVVDGIEIFPGEARSIPSLYEWAHVVLTQEPAGRGPVRMAAKCRRPIVAFVHNTDISKHIRAFGGCDLAVFPADWLRQRAHWNGPCLTLHLPVELKLSPQSHGNAITLVNVNEFKGAATFYELVTRMPKHEFLGVRGAWGLQVVPENMPQNVTILETTDDMNSVYRRTRILLMPSRAESYGRVALEAASFGIPVVSSPSEGVREALGDSVLLAPLGEIEAWIEQIEYLDRPLAYRRQARMVRERVSTMSHPSEFEEFERVLRSLAGKAEPLHATETLHRAQ